MYVHCGVFNIEYVIIRAFKGRLTKKNKKKCKKKIDIKVDKHFRLLLSSPKKSV